MVSPLQGLRFGGTRCLGFAEVKMLDKTLSVFLLKKESKGLSLSGRQVEKPTYF